MAEVSLAQLLKAVARRERLSRWGRRTYQLALPLLGVYALAVLVTRLLGAMPDFFAPWTVVIPLLAAGLIAAVWHRPPAATDAARLIDQATGSRDLFLTAALLDRAPGEFAPIVQREAVSKAAALQPAVIRPLQPWQRSGHVAVALLAILATIAWLPQLDPFGSVEQQKIQQERQKQLEVMRRTTEARAKALEAQPPDAPLSKPVDAGIEQLKQAFQSMQPQDPTGNVRKLSSMQQELGKLWRGAQEQALKQAMSQASQRFGGPAAQQRQEWREQLEQGSGAAMKQELAKMADLARELKQTNDPAKKEAIRQQLQRQLQQMADFAKSDLGAQGLSQALADAMQQLDMASMEGLQGEAADALAESLDLSAAEVESLAQAMRDMQSLQEAMKALQAARRANQQKPLDGKAGQCQSIGDYRQWYESQCKGQGQGQCDGNCNGDGTCSGGSMCKAGSGSGSGGGMGGPGQGRGNIAPEDPSQQMDFQTEKANSPYTSGKILMQWKTREVSDKGHAKIEYQQAMQQVRQNVNEAIVQEQVPPGYHESIQKYFDSIDRSAPDQDAAK